MAKKQVLPGTRNKLIFYIIIMIFPVVQFTIFYLIVNFNSLLLSFKKYENVAGNYVETFVGFRNIFGTYSKMFTEQQFLVYLKNSVLFYGISVISGTVFSLAFSYYIYKKGYLGGFFKVMLFLPNIVSGMVIAIMFKYFAEKGLPTMVNSLFGVTVPGFGENYDIMFKYVIFYNFYLGLSANMLVYTGTMSSISDSVIEAAQIDGVNSFQEFFHIIVPSIFNTVALFIITGTLTIFTGQAGLFSLFGLFAPQEFGTYGYYLYVQVKHAGINYPLLPPLASFGLCLTFIAIPVVFSLRYLLNKYGPSAD